MLFKCLVFIVRQSILPTMGKCDMMTMMKMMDPDMMGLIINKMVITGFNESVGKHSRCLK